MIHDDNRGRGVPEMIQTIALVAILLALATVVAVSVHGLIAEAFADLTLSPR